MKVTSKYVLFWGGMFSNFFLSPFTDEDENYFPTNEHYFMYQKAKFFKDYESASMILSAVTPKDAKNLGRKVKGFNADIWKDVSEGFMLKGLRLKFDQNKNCKVQLLRYPKLTFVESSPYDKIWGIGLSEEDPRALDSSTWEGENLLGKCLTKVRDEILIN